MNSVKASRLRLRCFEQCSRKQYVWLSRVGRHSYSTDLAKLSRIDVTERRYLCSKAIPQDAEIVEDSVSSMEEIESQPQTVDKQRTIITDKETFHGESELKSFVAETQRLLQIVAQSLYSDKEVFLRELVSNACDALEKQRIYSLTQRSDMELAPLEIHVKTDDVRGQLIIQDTGIGMTREEIVDNIGTIAKSGSKEFVEKMEKKAVNVTKDSIIGQFGVGFYSAFMVAKKVEVFTKSNTELDAEGSYWSSEGKESFILRNASNVIGGTKLVLTLKEDCLKFAQESIVKAILSKFASFFDKPIYLNGLKLQSSDPVWMKPQPTEQDLIGFYQTLVNSSSEPRFTLQYKTDVPLNMRCILFIPGESYNMFSALTPKDSGADVSLYSRKVLIQKRVDAKILPDWARFLKGVIDSEDIPLNLSREILQNSDLLFKMKRTLSARIVKFLLEKYKRNKDAYTYFYKDYGDFIREGVLSLMGDKVEQEQLMKLMLFQSSKLAQNEYCNIESYVERMKPGQREIYYLCAPSRELAETSPYMETIAASEKDYEVLYALRPFDDITLSQSFEFKGNRIMSVESAKFAKATANSSKSADSESDKGDVEERSAAQLVSHFQQVLSGLVQEVKVSNVDFKAPAIIRNFDMSMSRHMLLTALSDKSEEEKLKFLHAELELNPFHPIVKKVVELKDSDAELSRILARQILDNSLVAAGLTTDSRLLMKRLDSLLTKVAEKL